MQEIEALKKELEMKKDLEKKKKESEKAPREEQLEEKGETPRKIKQFKEINEQIPAFRISELVEKNLKSLERKISILSDNLLKNIELYKEKVYKFTESVMLSQKKIYKLLFLNAIILFLFLGLVMGGGYQVIKEIRALALNLPSLYPKVISRKVEDKVAEPVKEDKVREVGAEEQKKVKKIKGEKKFAEKTKRKVKPVKKKILKVSDYAILSKFKIKRYRDKKEGKSILAKGRIKNISSRVIDNLKMNIKLLDKRKRVIFEKSFNIIAKGEKKINEGAPLVAEESISFSVRVGPDISEWSGKCKYWLSNLVLEKK